MENDIINKIIRYGKFKEDLERKNKIYEQQEINKEKNKFLSFSERICQILKIARICDKNHLEIKGTAFDADSLSNNGIGFFYNADEINFIGIKECNKIESDSFITDGIETFTLSKNNLKSEAKLKDLKNFNYLYDNFEHEVYDYIDFMLKDLNIN